LQFWPRKRARKFLPRVNWDNIKDSSKVIKGFICYKAGMASAYVKDNTEHSLTSGKRIPVPVTVLECPPMKIYSIRLYKDGKVAKELLVENPEKEMKKKLKISKKKHGKIEEIKAEEFDDVRIVCYSQVKKTGIKKTPDLSELGLSGSVEEKINFIKERVGKEISVVDIFEANGLVDIRGLTKGHGFSGPVKRFGVTLRNHKSEKGRRGPGSIAPWHPARVTFRAPLAGQLGMFSRVTLNSKIVDMGNSTDKKGLKGIKNFGDVKTDYVVVYGSVQGPSKRQMLITAPFRETKKQLKKNYEFIELR